MQKSEGKQYAKKLTDLEREEQSIRAQMSSEQASNTPKHNEASVKTTKATQE